MPTYSSIDDFLRTRALPETETMNNIHVNGNDIVLTTSVPLDENEPEEETIDTSQLSLQDTERLRNEDAFMYHSIMNEMRRMRRPDIDYVLEVDASDNASHVPDPADAAAGSAHQDRVHVAFANTNNQDHSSQAPETAQQRVSSSARQLRRYSQSMPRALPSSDPRFDQRRLSQSFSSVSTGVVTRRRRISVETDHSEEMASLAASIRSSAPTEVSDLASLFDHNDDDNDGGALNGIDFSALIFE